MTPPTTPGPTPGPASGDSRRSSRGRRVAVGAVVLAVLALATTFVLTRPSDQPARADRPAPSDAQQERGRRAAADPGTSAAATATPTSRAAPTSSATPSRGSGAAGGTAGPTPAAPPPAPPTGARVATTSQPPATVGADVTLQPGLVATVTAVDAVTVEPRGPGDVAGPGAAVRLDLRNGTREAVDLAGLSVTATSADGAPAIPSDDRAAQPLTGRLLSGAQRSGTYVFRVADGGGPLRVAVGVNTSPEVAVVVG